MIEAVVRWHLIAALVGDAALAEAINGVFEPGEPGLTPPYALAGPMSARDWGSKDRAGRELTMTIELRDAARGGDEIARLAGLASAALLRAGRQVDAIAIASIALRKTTLDRTRGGEWRAMVDVRVRAMEI